MPPLDGGGEQRVDQPHHRLAVLAGVGLDAGVVNLAGLDLLQDAIDRQLVTVELVDGLVDLGLGGEQRHDLDVAAQQ